MAMTRKHFEALAQWAAAAGLTDEQQIQLADVLEHASDNEHFNRTRFLSAVGRHER